MMTSRHPPAASPGPRGQPAGLRTRLAAAEAALRAIRSGEVDAVVVEGTQGPQVFTLAGAEHAYRLLIEAMNEGALTLTADETILYANQCFARLVGCPLEEVIGSSFQRFLTAADQATLRPLLHQAAAAGAKIQVLLQAAGRAPTPVQISLRPLPRTKASRATIAMVVTDMTEVRRTEGLLRTLTHRVVQAQEGERGRVARDLHDGITQMLCAIVMRSQVLVDRLARRAGPALRESVQLRELAGLAGAEVERIAHNLRPGVLDHLGLVAALRTTCTEFAARTGVSVKVSCGALATRLTADTELTLYRILQEALRNVEKHAGAAHVKVRLREQRAGVQLVIADDGLGFDPLHPPARQNSGGGGFGLLGMRERVAFVGGTFAVVSALCTGTTIAVLIPPLPAPPP